MVEFLRAQTIRMDCEFIVLDNLPYQLILGRDVIKGMNMVIHGAGDRITIDGLAADEKLRISNVDKEREFLRNFQGLSINVLSEMSSSGVIENMVKKYQVQGGNTVKFYYSIRLNKGSRPVFKKNYRIEEAKNRFVIEKTRELLREGVVEESLSSWNSPLVVVKKGEGFRLCLDSRGVNEITELEVCQPPNVVEAIDALSKRKFFTQLDLKDGYNRVYLDESSRDVAALTALMGRFRYVGCRLD